MPRGLWMTTLDSFNGKDEVGKKNLIYVLIKFKPTYNLTTEAVRSLTSERKREMRSTLGGIQFRTLIYALTPLK